MNVLLISTSFIESSICENADIYFGIEIDCLYIFKENHATDSFHSNYDISLISQLDEVPQNCRVYIILSKEFSNNYTIGLLKHFRDRKMEVYLIVPVGYKNATVEKYGPCLIRQNIDFPIIKRSHPRNVFSKPVILIFGLSTYNQQIALELKLKSLFQKDRINCYYISYYQKNVEEPINNLNTFKDIRKIEQWLFPVSKRIDLADIVCLALPFNLQDRNVYGYGAVERIFDIVNPNHVICCIAREKELLNQIRKIEMRFSNKFGREINSIFVSDYESNESISPDVRRPMKSNRQIKSISKIKCKIYSKETIDQLYREVIQTLTLPNGVTII